MAPLLYTGLQGTADAGQDVLGLNQIAEVSHVPLPSQPASFIPSSAIGTTLVFTVPSTQFFGRHYKPRAAQP